MKENNYYANDLFETLAEALGPEYYYDMSISLFDLTDYEDEINY